MIERNDRNKEVKIRRKWNKIKLNGSKYKNMKRRKIKERLNFNQTCKIEICLFLNFYSTSNEKWSISNSNATYDNIVKENGLKENFILYFSFYIKSLSPSIIFTSFGIKSSLVVGRLNKLANLLHICLKRSHLFWRVKVKTNKYIARLNNSSCYSRSVHGQERLNYINLPHNKVV